MHGWLDSILRLILSQQCCTYHTQIDSYQNDVKRFGQWSFCGTTVRFCSECVLGDHRAEQNSVFEWPTARYSTALQILLWHTRQLSARFRVRQRWQRQQPHFYVNPCAARWRCVSTAAAVWWMSLTQILVMHGKFKLLIICSTYPNCIGADQQRRSFSHIVYRKNLLSKS